jgi:hypothetical protein
MSKRSVFQHVMSLIWWIRHAVWIVFLFAAMAGPFVVTRLLDFNTPTEFLWYSILSCLLVTGLAALVGALVGLLTAKHVISTAQDNVTEMIGNFAQEIEKVKDIQSSAAKHLDKLAEQVSSLDYEIARSQEIVQVALGRFEASIVDYHGLLEIEGSVEKDSDIFVLTSALELEDDELRDTIRTNFGKGVKYTYLIPDTPRLKKRMQDLAREWQTYCSASAKTQIRCFLVPKHFAYMTVIIYNPFKEPATVLVKFPKSDIYQKKKYPFIYKVDDEPREAWNTFVECVLELIENKDNQCPNIKPLELNFVET